ncbi:YSC84-related protein [Pseudomonadota bacterium]
MKLKIMAVLTALMTLVGTSAYAAATAEECQATFAKFKDLGNVPQLLAQTYGYAVLPTIGKGGTGCVFAAGEHTGNISMGQVTIGFQLGGQSYSQLILFQNADTYKEFTKGNFEFGADATAVALTYGAQAGATTKGASASAGDTKGAAAWKRGMAVYTIAKGGLMYEASIGGQKFKYKPLGD